MISFPNAKINLGLNIIRKRKDGFHDIQTVFYPVFHLFDALEFQKADTFSIHCTGMELNIPTEQNILYKVFKNVREKFPNLPSVEIHLMKNIPHGGGLGGGSSNAAFFLQMLDTCFSLKMPEEMKQEITLETGSDCPFFLKNVPSLAERRGDVLREIPLDLTPYTLQIICPEIHISTALAFAHCIPGEPERSPEQIIEQPVDTWKDHLKNDFEKEVFLMYPVLNKIKAQLYEQGALYASMSGTGSTIYGIFPKNEKADIRVDIGFREFLN